MKVMASLFYYLFFKNVSISSILRTYSIKSLPSSAEIVIAGGGIIGTSIAYHLAELGWKDIVILEQGRYENLI